MQPEQQQQIPQNQPQIQPQQSGWQFVSDENQSPPSQLQDTQISWTASEFVAYQKTAGWYFLMILGMLALAAIIFAVTQDWISTTSIILIGILFLAFASRKPRTLNYQITKDGIQIGEKLYAFNTLKSFAVIDEGSLHSVMLIPVQRFLPSISIYFDPQEEQKIVEAIGSYLPHEDRKQDAIDRFMHKIRF